MARAMKESIGNTLGLARAETREAKIRDLQDALNRLLGLSIAVDGIYGAATKDAVRTYQANHDMQIDGIAGPITKAELETDLAVLEASG